MAGFEEEDLTIAAHRSAGKASRYSSRRYLDFYEDATIVNSRENTPTGSPSRSEGNPSDHPLPPTIDKSLPTEDRDKSVPPRSRSTSPRRSPSPRRDESPPPSAPRRSKKSSSSDKPLNSKRSSSNDKFHKLMENLVKPLAEGFEAMRAQQKKTQEQVEALAQEDDEEPLDPAAATTNRTATRSARFGRRAALEFERMNRRLDEVDSKVHRATSSASELTKALADT
ncbi:unnamed protein product [Microthlaspi erraticum]|uniref:Uncharacterized protein n=1 Tax=Microthlaspi erraticum TaxID=1685480 RepID=A0A6D2JBS4_9BRAS|nr:unnamed protein product [Microthlaspi erraticum]